jgi:hypothetical protein
MLETNHVKPSTVWKVIGVIFTGASVALAIISLVINR